MVEGWVMRRLIARQKHEKCDMEKTSPPILSRLYQVISDGCIGFGQASKITETPFPFPYQNLLQVFLWLYTLTVPVVMNAWLKQDALRVLLTFLAVWCYFALHEVGNNLEDPYIPYDPNEIALAHIQHSFNAKLLSYGAVPTGSQDVASAAKTSQKDVVIASPAPASEAPPAVAQPPAAQAKGASLVEAPVPLPLTEDKEKLQHSSWRNRLLEGPGQSQTNQSPAVPQEMQQLQAADLPLVKQSLKELGEAHTRCLRLVGVVEGALAQKSAEAEVAPGPSLAPLPSPPKPV